MAADRCSSLDEVVCQQYRARFLDSQRCDSKQTYLRVDTTQFHTLDEAVDSGRDLGSTLKPRPVVILTAKKRVLAALGSVAVNLHERSSRKTVSAFHLESTHSMALRGPLSEISGAVHTVYTLLWKALVQLVDEVPLRQVTFESLFE